MTSCPSTAAGAVAGVVVDPVTAATPAMAPALSRQGLLAAAAAAATAIPALDTSAATLVTPTA